MNAYEVDPDNTYNAQVHLVIADSVSKVEELWMKQYNRRPVQVRRISEYVLVQGLD